MPLKVVVPRLQTDSYTQMGFICRHNESDHIGKDTTGQGEVTLHGRKFHSSSLIVALVGWLMGDSL